MDSTRKASIAAGVLFIVATPASLAAAALSPALTGATYLVGVADQPERTAAAALLYLIAAGCSVCIAVALYPVVRQFQAGFAVGSVVFRTLEAAFYTFEVVCLLSVLSLGQALTSTPAADAAMYRVIGDSIVATREHAALAAVFAFVVGSFLYYVVLYRSRLVPRWLSGWGIVGDALMLTACLLALFSNSMITGYVPFVVPLGIQEIVFALWLLIKGFSPSPRLPAVRSDRSSSTPAVMTR